MLAHCIYWGLLVFALEIAIYSVCMWRGMSTQGPILYFSHLALYPTVCMWRLQTHLCPVPLGPGVMDSF